MATKVKCVYEDGIFRPVDDFDIKDRNEIVVEIIKKPKSSLKKQLKEAYEEMAEDNLRISKEWDHLEREASKHI